MRPAPPGMGRREFCRRAAGCFAAFAPFALGAVEDRPGFRLRYVLASSLYGTMPLRDILPEVSRSGALAIDLWPRVHGSQREEAEAMGREGFARLLEGHGVALGMTTRYDLGPFRLEDEIRYVKAFGGKLVVTGSRGPKGLAGKELAAALRAFLEKMKPIAQLAGEEGITVAIENHGNSLVSSLESIRRFRDLAASPRLGIALAPYHLRQDTGEIARLIEDLGPRLAHFYAWQHGRGSGEGLADEDELLQMPGRGGLDFRPIVQALERIGYRGWTEVFMHPFPRGVPIRAMAREVTDEVNRVRRYLERCAERA